jgi:hypothetical protein
MTVALELGIVMWRHAVIADDVMAFRQKPTREIEADEAGGSGDENLPGDVLKPSKNANWRQDPTKIKAF